MPSDLARDRKTLCNPPVGKKRRTTLVNTKSEPKSVSPKERVREFKVEALVVSCGKLFCSACREQVSLKKSVIKLHVDSQKHKNSKEKLHKKEATQRDIAGALKNYDSTCHPKGESLPEDVRVYRVSVVMAFLRAGVPKIKD